MTVPRSLDPGTGPRPLPDFSRGAATVERMLRAVEGLRPAPGEVAAPRDAAGTRPGEGRSAPAPRVLLPAHALRRSVVGAVAGAAGLAGATVAAGAGVLLALSRTGPGAPSLGLLAAEAALGLLVLVLGGLGLRFALSGLAAARARVEIGAEEIVSRGALRTRRVRWEDVVDVEARVVHPVHWLTVALRLRGGRRVVLPALDRPVREHGRPSAEGVRILRRELHRRRRRGPGRR
ncbi:PH domain-containing protein [Brachybacterium squillarum]|uniref:PH domain-containing protein n=1 Tax=Brachybacterium squillarum TaxID=661979 RepID=UPI00222187E0|nr:PH domain-containing protein [Brachybacterium squillarum]MCW1805008.1 PH domain-containing protein [Brachybacterium squillarum]